MIMEHMATQVGVVLQNQLLSERTKRVNGQVVSLLEIVKSLHSNMGINSLMFTITEKSPSLVDAERCTLYLVGVLQLINKMSMPCFQQEDEILLQSFVDIAGKILSSSQLFEKSSSKQKQNVHIDMAVVSNKTSSLDRKKQMNKTGSKMQMSSLGEREEEEEEGEEWKFFYI